jgi:MoxR-like ATPase
MTAPALGGGTEWKDGQLTAAMRKPGCVILVDEPTVARPGALYLLQAVLDSREMHIDETGEVIAAADGVVFILADNTNGTGDHTGQYAGTGQISRATVDRMGASAVVSYLPADSEARVIAAKTHAPASLAGLLVAFANVTRADNAKGALANAVGLRRLLSWAEMLVDGVGVTEAAELAFLNTSSPDDTETLRQLLRTHCSVALVKRALAGEDVTLAAPNASTPEGAAAASTFGQVD